MKKWSEREYLQSAFENPSFVREFDENDGIASMSFDAQSFCTRTGIFCFDGMQTQLSGPAQRVEHCFALTRRELYKCRGGEADELETQLDDFVYMASRRLLIFWDENLVLEDERSSRRMYLEAEEVLYLCSFAENVYCATKTGVVLRLDLNKAHEGLAAIGSLAFEEICGMQASEHYLLVHRQHATDVYKMDGWKLLKTFIGARRAQLADFGSGEDFVLDYERGTGWRVSDFESFTIPTSAVFNRQFFVFGAAIFRLL